ncbi:MAG: SUMF1/EgtB/PvdO family nonheme iron enzyme [Microcoleaceae cyanobacterium]
MVWQWITNLADSINSSLQMMYAPPNINGFSEKQNLLDRISADFQLEEARQKFQSDIATRQQKYQLEKLKSQFLYQYLSMKNQDFEETKITENLTKKIQQTELTPENIAILEDFQNNWQNLQKEDKNKFETRLIEKRKQQDIALKKYDRETQIIVASVSLQNRLKSTEYTLILENHPLGQITTPTLDFYKQYLDASKAVPPLIILSPPVLKFEEYPHAARGFSQMAARLTDELRDFLNANYSIHNQIRPAKFLGGAIKNQEFDSEAALEIIHWTHKSVPTLILESKVNGDTLKLYLAWWDIMEEIPHYQKVISICWKDALYPLAKENANLWQAERQELLAAGKTLEEIIEVGGDDEYNLQILEAETRDEKRGVKRPRQYRVNAEEYIQELTDFLLLCHIILTGLALDSYYLVNYHIPPLLPEQLPNLLVKIPNTNLQDKLVTVVVENYRQIYQKLKWQLPDLIPELALYLAEKLTNLDNKSWARGQLNYALLIWLELRQVPEPLNPDCSKEKILLNSPFESINKNQSKPLPIKGDRHITNTLLEQMESVLSPLDITYVDSVNQCLKALGDETQLSIVDTYYNRGIRHCKAEAYQAGIDDFNTAIFLNPEFIDAYYHRANAYAELEKYQEAISDYNKVLELQPNYAGAYHNRGKIYQELGEEQKANNDYEQAQNIQADSEQKSQQANNDYEQAQNLKPDSEEKTQAANNNYEQPQNLKPDSEEKTQAVNNNYEQANNFSPDSEEKTQAVNNNYEQTKNLQPDSEEKTKTQAVNNNYEQANNLQPDSEEKTQAVNNNYEQTKNLQPDSEEKTQDIIQEALNEITEQRQRDSVKKAALTDQCSQVQKSSITQNFLFGIVSLDSLGNEIIQEQKKVNIEIEDLGNEIKLEMVYIPAGNFIMGAASYEAEKEPYELPQHQVSLDSFYMSKYPITQAQWEVIMGTKPAEFPGENRPVENVSWYDAAEFCDRLGEKTGTAYRLPSEAEWEYACRGGTTSPYHFGETITTTVANYNGQYNYKHGPQGIHRQQTTNVGSFAPNGFGLCDMHGNVWEWCADPWHDNYYGAPSDGSVWELDGDNSRRVVRGGTWYLPPKYCRSAFRASYVPDGKRWDCGFRVVFSAL